MDGLIWMEGLPPELAQRGREAIAQMNAALAAYDADEDCPLALAALLAARREGENCAALLHEWYVTEEVA